MAKNDLKIDLKRYQTAELAVQIAEILAVFKSIQTILITVVGFTLSVFVANTTLYLIGNPSFWPWLLSSLYALNVAAMLGFVLGLLIVARQLIFRSETLLRLTLGIAREVARDYRKVSSGGKQMLTATEIVEHVYGDVVLPAMEQAVARTLGIVGRPLLWVYRRTIGGGVRYLLTKIKTDAIEQDERAEIEATGREVIQDVGRNAAKIDAVLLRAIGYTDFAASMLRRWVLFPIQVAFGVVTVLLLMLLGLCWYWTR